MDSTLVTTVVDIEQNGSAVESSQNGVNMGEGQTRSRDQSQVEDSRQHGGCEERKKKKRRGGKKLGGYL